MNLFAILRIALNALRVNKLRSTLTMLGIIIGVAAVIIMIAIGNGAQARVEEQIKSLGANLMIIIPGATLSGGARGAAGSQQTLTEDDAAAIAREVPEVQVAAPSQRSSGQVVAGNSNWSTVLQGVTNDYFEAREWPLVAGRLFEPPELQTAGKVAIIGHSTAKQLFGEEYDPAAIIGQTVRVRQVPAVIVGVLDKKGQSMIGQDQDDVLFLPLATLRNRISGQTQGKLRRVGLISVKTREGQSMAEAEDKIRSLLRQLHGAQPHRDFAGAGSLLENHDAAARRCRLGIAGGGRHRHHEHHAGVGD